MIDPAELRREYARAGLRRSEMDPDPFREFAKWFDAAVASGNAEPNAMTLSTTNIDGFPSSRTVLLKVFDARGFCFFTNYGSRKARELAENPRASLTFFWYNLERQVSIAGSVERTSSEESAKYFHSRPRGSQLGALVSTQSEIIPNRAFLEQRLAELEAQYAGFNEIPLPDFWGGFRLKPVRFEFWQGRPNRLHDRFQYVLTDAGSWQMDRLSP
ncbi:MAG TPA: pyridoxamine 5'-phosphate oxidase [Chthoniobacterales bacterium]